MFQLVLGRGAEPQGLGQMEAGLRKRARGTEEGGLGSRRGPTLSWGSQALGWGYVTPQVHGGVLEVLVAICFFENSLIIV